MAEFPQYDESGNERMSFENIWRNIDPQELLGVDCFNPYVDLREIDNLVSLRLTADEFKEMFSALYNGAELTYPDRFMQIIVNFLKGIHCDPIVQEDECTDFPTYAQFMHYTPADPFNDPEEIPDGYLTPPFIINGRNGVDIPNYEVDDVIVPLDAITLDVDWLETIDGQLPTITVDLVGSGSVLVKLLSIGFGGVAVVTLDSPPNILDIIVGIVTGAENIVDLNQDLVSLPPETAIELDFPVEIETAGEHTIYIVFLPIIDDSLTPIRFGGGFRGVNLCDFEEMPIMSCEDIEDCLETSETIIEITNNIAENTTNITNLSNSISEIEDCGCGGNEYPEPPDDYESTLPDPEQNSICASAHAIAQGLWQNANDVFNAQADSDFATWLYTKMKEGGFVFDWMQPFWDLLLPEDPEAFIIEMDNYKDKIAEAFFCNLLDREAAKAEFMADESIPLDVRTAYSYSMDTWAGSAFEFAASVGVYLNGTGYDCSSMCDWVIYWMFNGEEPPDDDGDFVYYGDTWEVEGGIFEEGIGYKGIVAIWNISKQLPSQCRLTSMIINQNKNEPCLFVDVNTTWRGLTGDGTQEQTADARVLTDAPTNQNWDVHSAVLTEMLIEHQHGLCDPDTAFGSQIHWVKIVGKGSRPI